MGNAAAVSPANSSHAAVPASAPAALSTSRHPTIPAVNLDRFDPAIYRADELELILKDFSALPAKLLTAGKDGYVFHIEDMSREEGVLTPLTLRRSFFAFSRLSDADRKYFLGLLDTFLTGDDTQLVGRAILVKALGFNEFDRDVFIAFSNNLHAYDARQMLNRTTLTEIDPQTDTDSYGRYGVWQRERDGDSRVNDGAKQNFTTSCMPSSVLLYKGEINPIYALDMRERGFDAPTSRSPWLAEQLRMMRASEVWSRQFVTPTWRVTEYLLNEGHLVELLAELRQGGAFDGEMHVALLQRLYYFAEGPAIFTTLKARIEKELMGLNAFIPRGLGRAGDRYAEIYGTPAELFGLYESDLRELLVPQGFPRDNGWSVKDLFDNAQFFMVGSPYNEVFLPQNAGDDFTGAGVGNFQQPEALVELLASGQDVILSLNSHVTLLTDIRRWDGEFEIYAADPDFGTGTWLKLSAVPQSAKFYYPIR